MHSHLVPGIDDGAQDPEQSLRYIDAMRSLGWKGIITTPHIFSDLYPNNRSTIQTPFEQLKQQLDPSFLLNFAAEYMIDSAFETFLNTDQILTFGDNYVLIEMSYLGESRNIRDMIFQLKIKGYQPVLAHPERYLFYQKNYKVFEEFKDMGCLLQLNILSLSGYYGPLVKKIGLQLLSDRLYDFAGTDLHHDRHLNALVQMRTSKVMKDLSVYPFHNAKLADNAFTTGINS